MREHWKKLDTKMVNIDNIHVVDRIMHPTQKRIDAMAKSLSGEMGQINAVLITKYNYSSWKVVAGATRVLAAEKLGWKQIEATIIGADNDFEYQLIEVAENLHRHDLSDTERVKLKRVESDLFTKRRAFFDKLLAEHPELVTTKAKGGRGKKGGVREAARKAGVSKSAAQDRANSPNRKHTKKLPADDQAGSLPEPEPPHNDQSRQEPGPVESFTPWRTDRPADAPAQKQCPTCHGTGRVDIEED